MERSRNAINSIIFGFIFRLVTMVGPFITRIIVTWTIGKEFLGVSGVFSSILSMLSLTELGFSSAISYKCYSLYAENNVVSIRRYLGFFRKIYRGIGTVIIILGVIITPFLSQIVSGEIPKCLNLYIIFYIYLFQTAISYYLAAYRAVIFTVSQRQDIESKIAVIWNSVMYLLQIILLLLFKNYYVYLIVLPITTIAINLSRIVISNKLYPELKAEGDISKAEKKEIFQAILPLIGHRLHGTIVISADNIIISMFLGVVMVANYNNYFSIISALSGFIIAIYAAIQPGIGNLMATESMKKNRDNFEKISFAMIWIVGWMSICLTCLFEDFISLAYGNESNLGIGAVVLLVLEFYIWRTFDIVMTYRDVVGKWSGDTVIPYLSGAFNLITNLLLVKYIGIVGVILSTILTFVLFSIPYSIRVLFKKVFKSSLKNYLIKYICNTATVIVIGSVTYFVCNSIFLKEMFITLVIKCIICLLLPNLMFYFLWHNREEYHYFKEKVIKPFIQKVKR